MRLKASICLKVNTDSGVHLRNLPSANARRSTSSSFSLRKEKKGIKVLFHLEQGIIGTHIFDMHPSILFRNPRQRKIPLMVLSAVHCTCEKA